QTRTKTRLGESGHLFVARLSESGRATSKDPTRRVGLRRGLLALLLAGELFEPLSVIVVGQRLQVRRLPGQVPPGGCSLFPGFGSLPLQGGTLVGLAAEAESESRKHVRSFLFQLCLKAPGHVQAGGPGHVSRPGATRLIPEAFSL